MFSDGFIVIGDCRIRPALVALILYGIVAIGFFFCEKYAFGCVDNGKWIRNRKRLLYICLAVLFFWLQFFYKSNDASEKPWFFQVLEKYLETENFLALALIFLTVFGVTFEGNVHQYFGMILKLVRVFSVVFIYGNFLTGVCVYSIPNIILLGIMWTILIASANYTIVEIVENGTNQQSRYSPKEKYEELSPDLKKIADLLFNIIVSDTSSTYSICLAGDWGIGKTSIMKGVEQQLKGLSIQGEKRKKFVQRLKELFLLREKQNKYIKKDRSVVRYEFIHINALELDTVDSLFLYLFSRIKQILREHGMYVGVGSTYRKFIGSAIDTITQSSLSLLLEGEIFARNEDYRAQKEELSHLIARVMHSERIIVVVDDIERCEQKKIKEYLFFVKEIASMERCIPVFVTDYSKLVEQIKESDENPHVFLDKFFNYTVHVTSSAVEDVITQMQVELNQVTAETNIQYLREANIKSTLEQFQKNLNSMVQSISSNEQDSGVKNDGNHGKREKEAMATKEALVKFQNNTTNTRTIVHICRKLVQYYRVLRDQYRDRNDKAGASNKQIESYAKQIQLNNIIFFLAYVECCMPLEFGLLAKSCEDYIFDHRRTEEYTEERLEVLVMSRGLLFKNETLFGEKVGDIHTDKAVEFVSILINQPENLLEIVDWYETKIKKAKDLLLAKKFSEINLDWSELMKRLLQEQYLDFGEAKSEDKQIISGLIEYLKFKLSNKQITSRDLLEAMIEKHSQKFFVSRAGFMQEMEELIEEYPVVIPMTDKLHRELGTFKANYIWEWFTYYIRLVEYVSEEEVTWTDSIDYWIHKYFGEDFDTGDFIKKAIEKVSTGANLYCIKGENAIDKLRNLTNYLCEKCCGSELYPEIEYNLGYIKCAPDEISSWIGIENILTKESIRPESDFSDIKQSILYFEHQDINDYEMSALFSSFIRSLKNCELEDTDENRKIIQSIHNVLSRYLQQHQMNHTKYRKIVCDLEKRMTPNHEVDV